MDRDFIEKRLHEQLIYMLDLRPKYESRQSERYQELWKSAHGQFIYFKEKLDRLEEGKPGSKTMIDKENEIRNLRINIDSVFTSIGNISTTRETSLAKTSFQNSKMMLGKVLQCIGTANPYPESKNPSSQKIERTAEASDAIAWKEDATEITKVKHLRMFSDGICSTLKSLIDNEMADEQSNWEIRLFLMESFLECQKGMMWLGMELGRIRDSEEKKEA